MSRAALEYIGRGGLGESFGPLDDDRATDHSEAISRIRLVKTLRTLSMLVEPCYGSPSMARTMHFHFLTPFLSKIGTPAFRRRVLELLPFKSIHEPLGIIDVLYREATAVVHKRRAALETGEKGVGQGHDILSVLCTQNSSLSLFETVYLLLT